MISKKTLIILRVLVWMAFGVSILLWATRNEAVPIGAYLVPILFAAGMVAIIEYGMKRWSK